ncbi:MAG: Glutamyl-tRNA(Gln) amidotransferase subunit, partial [Myxococcaceae bacterium]|nr:Glutamyl-tRNA(Gln) amidotransferase subunit [Myxococcaceae bacterium]
MHEGEILSASGVALARAIRDRLITSRAVVQAHVDRARRVNPALNAIVRDRYEEALREATIADEKTSSLHRDDLPVLHGVPCTIKEAFAVEGMPNSAGLWTRRDVVATKDA